MDLFDLIGFADQNKIDYKTDVYDIIEAYKALEKIKNSKKESLSAKEALKVSEIYDMAAEKAAVEMTKDQLLKWYNNCCMCRSLKIGSNIEKFFDENLKGFEFDNAMILNEDITYIGTFTEAVRWGVSTTLIKSRVFVDKKLFPDDVIVNFHENGLEKKLKPLYPNVKIEHNVCR